MVKGGTSEQMNLASATVKASDYVKIKGLRMVRVRHSGSFQAALLAMSFYLEIVGADVCMLCQVTLYEQRKQPDTLS